MGNDVTNQAVSQILGERLREFVGPLLAELDEQIDKRLVRTFEKTLQVIIQFRHGSYGLLLSELGGYITSPSQAPAGTKRLSNLLRCGKWAYQLIEQFLWAQAEDRVQELVRAREMALVVWDESVWEKGESLSGEGLCPVRSSKARRLKRIRPGFFNPPEGRPICVPGLNWLGIMVMGRSGPPLVAAMHWWTTRGHLKSDKRTEEKTLLKRCAQAWGVGVLHIWDRGFAGNPWLTAALDNGIRFVMRWIKSYNLIDVKGQPRKAWQITRGQRSQDHRYLWDARRRCHRKVGLLYLPVTHPQHPGQILWLIVARPGKPGQSPWYLLTNEAILSPDDAWNIILAYARRWQIEMSWRFGKSELAMESPRLWFWQNRLKLLLMVTLAYAFLLSLLDPGFDALRTWLLRNWCHRTGKRYRDASIPLYRLRSALSRLWLAHPPPPPQNSG